MGSHVAVFVPSRACFAPSGVWAVMHLEAVDGIGDSELHVQYF